jgi:hypothetical protein
MHAKGCKCGRPVHMEAVVSAAWKAIIKKIVHPL